MSVDGLLIGVRTIPEFDRALRALFAPIAIDVEVPANYSLFPAEDAQGFHFLYRGGCTALRTRDRNRLLHGLVRHLAGHRPPQPGTMRTHTVAVIRAGGDAVLLPDIRAELAHFERRLRQSGLTILDDPWTDIDTAAGDLVVPDGAVKIEPSVLDRFRGALRDGPAEPVVAPGRYSLAGWLFWDASGDGRPLVRADAAHRAYTSLSKVADRFVGVVPLAELGQLFGAISARTTSNQPATLAAAVIALPPRPKLR